MGLPTRPVNPKTQNTRMRQPSSILQARTKPQFNSMSKSEIKTKRLKSRGLLTRRASGEEPFATRPYGKVDPIESKQRVGITDRFIYELVEFTS